MAPIRELTWASQDARSLMPCCCHEVFRSVESIEQCSSEPVIKLHIGEPHFSPPADAVDALVGAARSGRTGYTSAEGMPQLRAALATKLNDLNGIEASADHVLVCPGSTQGLAALIKTIADPGSEILLPSIYWPVYVQQCLLAGCTPTFYQLRSDFSVDPCAITEAASVHTRVLLLNSPSNPTGSVCPEATLKHLLEMAHDRGWIVVSDEAYEDFVYDGKHISIASLEKHLPEKERRVFSVFSFSKTYAMTGFRLGYVAAPSIEAASLLRTVQEAQIVAPCTPVQLAGLAALSSHRSIDRRMKQLRETRDEALLPLLKEGLIASLPQGGWYTIVNLRPTGIAATEFATQLLCRYRVAVTPAAGFASRPPLGAKADAQQVWTHKDAPHLLRLAFCGNPLHVRLGVKRLKSSLDECVSVNQRTAVPPIRKGETLSLST